MGDGGFGPLWGDREGLDAQITLEKLQKAVAGMENQKSPGPDGLPVEV